MVKQRWRVQLAPMLLLAVGKYWRSMYRWKVCWHAQILLGLSRHDTHDVTCRVRLIPTCSLPIIIIFVRKLQIWFKLPSLWTVLITSNDFNIMHGTNEWIIYNKTFFQYPDWFLSVPDSCCPYPGISGLENLSTNNFNYNMMFLCQHKW